MNIIIRLIAASPIIVLAFSSSICFAKPSFIPDEIISLKMNDVRTELTHFAQIKSSDFVEISSAREPIVRDLRIINHRIKIQKQEKELSESYYSLLATVGETKADHLFLNFDVGHHVYALNPDTFFSLFLTDLSNLEIEDVALMRSLAKAVAKISFFQKPSFFTHFISRIDNIFQLRVFLGGIKAGRSHDRFFNLALQVSTHLQARAFELLFKHKYFNQDIYLSLALKITNERQLIEFNEGIIKKIKDTEYYLNILEYHK